MASDNGGPASIFRRIFSGGAGGRDVWLIIGLGNPGEEYAATKHNVGFRTIDKISAKTSIPVKKSKFGSHIGEGRYGENKIVLVKPQTYMNLSGEAVRRALDFYKAPPERMIVVYDDVDVELGKIRLRAFGGAGSHNGMRSIAEHIGEGAKFPRIRIGIGRQPKTMDLKDYVLTRFSRAEEAAAEGAVTGAADAALGIVEFGIERAMNEHNPKRNEGRNVGK